VELGALGGQPTDQPDVNAGVAINPLMPAGFGIKVDERVFTAYHLVCDMTGELDEFDDIAGTRARTHLVAA
jgi:hypothetical protein